MDAAGQTAVWRGIAKDEISTSGTAAERDRRVANALETLFEGFPPSS